jgi:cob(I)alamin adenosyltransferase
MLYVRKGTGKSVARIYTRTGDDGTTGLIGGKRVSKDSPHIEATGSLDELNAQLGVVRSHALSGEVDEILYLVQDAIFTIGAELATPEGTDPRSKAIRDEDVQTLEKKIDHFESMLPPLRKFVLPGGTVSGAALHVSRAVARRAERACVALSRTQTVDKQVLQYLNRLSDLLFVLARYVNHQDSVPEHNPTFGRST